MFVTGFTATLKGPVPVAVTLPDGHGGYRTSVGPTDRITARVTCLFPCRVPIASSVACRRFGELDAERRAELETAGRTVELARVSGCRFVALAAEQSLVNQGKQP